MGPKAKRYSTISEGEIKKFSQSRNSSESWLFHSSNWLFVFGGLQASHGQSAAKPVDSSATNIMMKFCTVARSTSTQRQQQVSTFGHILSYFRKLHTLTIHHASQLTFVVRLVSYWKRRESEGSLLACCLHECSSKELRVCFASCRYLIVRRQSKDN